MSVFRALVVEDDFVSRKLVSEVLRKDFHCDSASDGLEALEAYNLSVAQARPYDVIVLDLSMPRVSGPRALRLIRDAEEKEGIASGQGVPVLVLTAHRCAFTAAFRAGCDAYLTKPVRPAILLAKAKELAGTKRGQK
ncbi:MAG TPA: response regulator [Elusimicrobiales bacterium]|nr:response regulator [Elusimicrobiales bacterium]